MDKNEIRDLLPLYAIGALDEDEHTQVSEYLSAHPEMMNEYEEYQKTTESLSSLNMKAPDGLIDSIMEKIETPSSPEVNILEKFFNYIFPATPARGFVFASLLILFGLSVTFNGVLLYNSSKPAINMHSVINLQGEAANSTAKGSIVITENKNSGVLYVEGLPRLDETRSYQLWLIKDGKRTSGGVFNIAQSGAVKINITSNIPITQYQAFGITVEPAGGSPLPTGKKVMGS